MPKRFTDSNKWADPWFMDLPSKYKLFWIYLLDNCDHAGVWKVNFKVASFYIGEHLEPSEVKRLLSGRVNEIDDTYWHIEKFIEFQYGGIKSDAVGQSVAKILQKHNISVNIEGAKKGLDRGLAGTKAKDKVKDKVKAKDSIPTFQEFDSAIDSIYREQLTMTHRGKDIDKAVKEAFTYLIADETRAKNSDTGDFKRLVNTWLGNMKGEKVNPNPYKLH